MNIYGKSIVLRAISESDASLLLQMINDPETERMLGGSSFPVSMSAQQSWIQRQANNSDVLRCIIADRSDAEAALGTVILSDIDRKNGCAQVHIKMGTENCRGNHCNTQKVRKVNRILVEAGYRPLTDAVDGYDENGVRMDT